mmetsp:Transcript_51644/g.63196  ORF Transcript_51644/g.63196 Transcript_51644/m.63196 type:complete len:220 (-) Transcript_51644:215-874(-)
MAFGQATLTATNVEVETELALAGLDAFQQVLCLAARISTCSVWILSICQLITSLVTFAQGELLIDQTRARLVWASSTCFITRNIVAFARDEEANLTLEEVHEAFRLGTGEGTQTHGCLALRQQGAFLVAKWAQEFLIMRTNVSIKEILGSCQWIRGEDLHILATDQVIDGANLMWQQPTGGLVRCTRRRFLHILPNIRIDSSLLLRSQECAAVQIPAAA